jgi:hypothetical protein
MIEEIEELTFHAERHVLVNGKLLGQIQIAPGEVRSAQRVASKIPELAVLRRVSAIAGARAGIDSRDKGIGVQPLEGSRLGDAGIGDL